MSRCDGSGKILVGVHRWVETDYGGPDEDGNPIPIPVPMEQEEYADCPGCPQCEPCPDCDGIGHKKVEYGGSACPTCEGTGHLRRNGAEGGRP